MRYLKVFEKENNYTEYKNSSEWITPNISLIRETGSSKCKPYIPPPAIVGDVAYWDGFSVKTISKDKWNRTLGTPIGVVVIPEGMLPDGKARIVSLMPVDSNGNQSSSHISIEWGGRDTDTSLTNFTKVPTTDNAGSTSSGSYGFGFLPSDSFTGATSFVDPKAKYYGNSNLIPSPYLGDIPNPEYSKEILIVN